jgi:polyisoprenoid-binding protein YceI
MLHCKWPPLALAPMIVLIGACTHVPVPPAIPPVVAGQTLPPGAKPAGSVDFRIDTEHSELRVLVYRGGALAKLGHNHVIQSHGLSGWIRAAGTSKDSSFYLQLMPADFQIDQPAARAEEGADFAEEVDDTARAGTRRNMLGGALLDADRYPLILIQSVRLEGEGPLIAGARMATVRITIAGHTREVSAPFSFEGPPESLHVTADFRLAQSALGLTPFNALMGGLQVEDEMHMKLDIRAISDQSAGAG